jgi:acyl-CoA reductase-like NAD-dependent aldehyde dehydrogenase
LKQPAKVSLPQRNNREETIDMDLLSETPATNGSTYTVPTFINGEEQVLGRTFDVINPATQEVSYQCSSANVTEAESAVAAAAAAFPGWSRTSANERRKVFLKAAEVMERRRAELVGYMLQETGDDASWCHFNIDVAIDCIRDVGGRCVTLAGAIPLTQDPGVTGLVLKEPYGVVLSMAPWWVVLVPSELAFFI